MHDHIDKFQSKLRQYFNEMILGSAFVQLGRYVEHPEGIDIEVKLATDKTSEPTPLADLIHHAGGVGAGVTEFFQVRAIAAWNDLLTDLFGSFVHAHLNGQKTFSSLKKRSATIDFSSQEPIVVQLHRSIVRDYSFAPYDKRLSIIKELCESSPSVVKDLKFVGKHVDIRNSLQHHGGVVTEEILKGLGSSKIELLDDQGEVIYSKLSDRIRLYIPELNLLKSALFRITINWREALNADI